MSRERLQMQGRAAELKSELSGLRLRAEGLCRSVREGLNPVLIDVEAMNIALVSEEMDSLISLHIDMLEARQQLQKIERELGRGR